MRNIPMAPLSTLFLKSRLQSILTVRPWFLTGNISHTEN